MADILDRVKQGLITLGITLLLMVGLLMAVVLARPLMILALAAAFVAVLVSMLSPRLRLWLEPPG